MNYSLKTIKRMTLLLSSFFIFSDSILAQSENIEKREIFNNRLHIELSTNQFVVAKPKTKLQLGRIPIHAHYSYGFELNAEIAFQFNKYLGISAGAGLGFIKTHYSFNTDFNALYNNSSVFGDVKSWGESSFVLPYASIPIGIQARLPVSEKFYIPFSYSVVSKVIPAAQYVSMNGVTTDSGQSYNVAFLSLGSGTSEFFIDHQFSIGANLILPNNKILDFRFVVNINSNRPFRGSYWFVYDTPEVTIGDYVVSLQYYGIKFGYIFTGVRKTKKEKKVKY